MYNFLKYKHNWKKCPVCDGKMKKTENFDFSTMHQCQQCKRIVPECELKKIPMKRYFKAKLRY